MRAVELWRNLQVRGGKPDPLCADVVHVREDRRDGAGFAGRFSSPDRRLKALDKHLVYTIIGGKYLDRGSAELCVSLSPVNLLSLNLALTRNHETDS
jgi:hypothetical protein